MSMCRVAAVAGAFLIGLAPAAAEPPPARPGAAPRVDLRPKFRPGQQIRYTMVLNSQNQTAAPDLPELEQKQKLKEEIGLVMKVVESSADGATVQLVYETMKVSLDSGDVKAEYDSTRPQTAPKPSTPPPAPATTQPPRPTRTPTTRPGTRPSPNPKHTPTTTPSPAPSPGPTPSGRPGSADEANDLLATLVRGMVGTVITMKVDPRGNVVSVTGGEALTGNGIPGLMPGGSGMPGPTPQGALNWIIQSPGTDGMATVGESWTNEDKVENSPIGGFKMVTTHKLTSAHGGLATVTFTGRMERLSEAAGAPGGGGGGGGTTAFQVKRSHYGGRYLWDTEGGALREMESEQSVAIEGRVSDVGMTMTSESSVKITRAR